MYFQKKSKVAVLLIILLISVAGLLLFIKTGTGGITGAVTSTAESSSDLLIQPIVELEPDDMPVKEEQASTSENLSGETEEPSGEISLQAEVSPKELRPQALIDTCQNLLGGEYTLTQNVSAGGTCFHILGSSVTLDCDGFRITYGTVSDGTAINNTGGYDHIIIKNCDIIESVGRTNTPGITFKGVSNSTIEHNYIVSKGTYAVGIIMEESHNNTIAYNNISMTLANVRYSIGILFNATPTANFPSGNFIINNNFTQQNFSIFFQNYTSAHYLGLNNTLSYNTSLGAINWTNTNLTMTTNLSMEDGVGRNIFLENNRTGIANLNVSLNVGFQLNTSARIEIKNLSYRKTPGLFRNGIRCDNSTDATFVCNISSYDSGIGILYANITRFSNYTTSFVNFKPNISPVILNTTNISLNYTHVNLTAYVNATDIDTGDSVKVIYNWLVNNSPIALLNMPFEGVNGTNISNTIDYSGLGNNGSRPDAVTGGVSWNATGGYDGRGAYEFSGNCGGNCNAINITNKDYFNLSGRPFSVVAWAKTNQTSVGGAIIAKLPPGGGNGFNLRFTSGLPSFGVFGSITSSTAQNETTGWNDNNWHHYTGTFNGSEARLYIDGVLRANGSNANIGNPDNDQYVLIGKLSKSAAFFNGTIDDVTIFNRSLSPEQVFALWQNQTNVIVSNETAFGQNWTVQATPNDGYEDGQRNQSGNVTILDKTVPTVNITYPPNGSNFSARTIFFNATITDSESNISVVLFVFNNRTNPFNLTASNSSGTWNVTIDTSRLTEGLQGFAVAANDTANNLNYTEFINFTVDRTAPNVSFHTPPNASNFSAETIGFNLSILENFTQIQTAVLIFNTNATVFNKTLTNTSGNWSATINFSDFPEGLHSAIAYVNDSAGNVNNTVNISFTVDRAAPNVSFITPSNASNFSAKTVGFNLSILENVTQVHTALLMFNTNATVFNRTLTNTSGNWSATVNFSDFPEGLHSAIAYVNDSAGNLNNTVNISFTVDRAAPNVSFIIPINASNFSAETIGFNLSILENVTRVHTALLMFNTNATVFNRTLTNTSGNWSVTINFSDFPEGLHSAVAYVNDSAGNLNTTVNISFTVDRTIPSVNITSPEAGATISSMQSFNATVTDNVTAVNTVIFQFSNGTTPFNRTATNTSGVWGVNFETTIIEEGALSIIVFANDSVGNMNSTQTLVLTVDNILAQTGGGGETPALSKTTTTTAPSEPAPTEAPAPSPPAVSETASVAETINSFEKGQSSLSISKTGEKAVTSYTSDQSYKVTIINNLNKKMVLSGALKEKTQETPLENEENVKKRLKEELLLEGEADEAVIEEELSILKLLESVEILQVYKTKLSHFLPSPLTGVAVAAPLVPTGKHIEATLLIDVLLNVVELQYFEVNPGETVEKEVKIRRGLSFDQKPPQIIFSSGGEEILIKDLENHEELVIGTAVDVNPNTEKFDFYIVFPPQQQGGKEIFTVEMNINVKKSKVVSSMPLKVSLPFFLSGDSVSIFSELYGPYNVDLERGALLAVQYDASALPETYEVKSRVLDKQGKLVSENTFDVKT